jgi:transcriptional regulator of heat shock response
MPKKSTQQNQNELSQRQTKILFALIKEYCEIGETCGSKELMEKYKFEFSSATIRNEMVVLREKGYLFQPFINAPSCPTEMAFKLFVNKLIAGLGVANKQQQEMRNQILELQARQENMNRDIARLLSTQTDALSFAVNSKSENVTGIRHLLEGKTDQAPVSEVLEFLDNLDTYKQHLLTDGSDNEQRKIKTIFGSESSVLPLGPGYALVATEIELEGERTVVGIISPTHLLTNPKKLSAIEAISNALGKK